MQDETYQDRYAERTRDKIAAIMENIDPTDRRCLDIGCNRGELCRELLRHRNVHVVGLDLVDGVDVDVRSRRVFTFEHGDVAQIDLPQVDATFCLSVLHHVLGHHGWDVYEATLRRVLQSAPVVFLEVGVPSEEGSFYWKDRILAQFNNDASWLSMILCHPLVENSERVVELPIHGSVRSVYRIETVTPKGGE